LVGVLAVVGGRFTATSSSDDDGDQDARNAQVVHDLQRSKLCADASSARFRDLPIAVEQCLVGNTRHVRSMHLDRADIPT
jgi:hypothetical protein